MVVASKLLVKGNRYEITLVRRRWRWMFEDKLAGLGRSWVLRSGGRY